MKPSLSRWWRYPQAERLINRYLALAPREQRLLQITLHTLLTLLLTLMVLEPVWLRIQSHHQVAAQAETEARQLQQQAQRLRDTPPHDPDEALRRQLAQLAGEQALLDERIGRLTDALVTPAQMVPLLKALLEQDARLQLIALSSLPRQTLTLDAADPEAVLYRHALRIQLKATYPGLTAYQQRLDRLPWRIYWQTLDYRVTDYPYAEVQIELYTLSLSEEVVGG